jgi:hypothetical protein
MCRTLAFLILIALIAGCTRYGANPPGGPFARKPKSDTDTTSPPAPAANNSPLALGTPNPSPPGGVVEDNTIVPPRPPESIRLATGGENVPGVSIPMGGIDCSEGIAATSPGLHRQSDPPQNKLPAPIGPIDSAAVLPAGGSAPIKPPTGPSAAALNIAEVKKIVRFAADKWAKVNTYEANVTRKELTPAKEMSEDYVLYQYRKEPVSVFIRNIGESGKGRELLYNPTKHGDKIYVMLGEGDNKSSPIPLPFVKAGFKAPPMSPDDPRVKEKARYSIREAGYGTPINKLTSWIAKAESGRIPADALTFLGPVKRKEYPYPLFGVSLKLRPGDEATMPNGGMRQWFFDPKSDSGSFGWPVLIIATEPDGREVEYYLFENVKLEVRLTDADFAPERLGRKP